MDDRLIGLTIKHLEMSLVEQEDGHDQMVHNMDPQDPEYNELVQQSEEEIRELKEVIRELKQLKK